MARGAPLHRGRDALPGQCAGGLHHPRAAGDGRRRLLGQARAVGGPGPDGLPLLPAGAGRGRSKAPWPSRGTCGCSSICAARPTRPAVLLAEEKGACQDAAERGVMERFSHKLAIAPTASISIICGGTSAGIEPIPANIYTPQDPVGLVRGQEPLSGAAAGRARASNTEAIWNSILEQRRLGAASRRPEPRTRRASSRPPSNWTSAGSSNCRPTARRKSARPSRSTCSSPAT